MVAGASVAQNPAAAPTPARPTASDQTAGPRPATAAASQVKIPTADDREFLIAQAHFQARNYQDAYLRLLPLAHRGHTESQYLLGLMSDNGVGPVQLDPREANHWYRLAADKNHAEAQFALSNAYANGRGGLPISPADMLVWLRKAAENSYMPAMVALAALYDYGMGVPRDVTEGSVWVKRAADSGSVNATYQYARRLETGFGVEKNEREAAEWYRRAAMRGHPSAQLWLGSIGDVSLASQEQNIEALFWLNLASRNGPADVKALALQRTRDLQKNMMPSDITEAQTRARAWKPASQLPGLKPDPEYDLPGGVAQSGKAAQQPRRGG
jgi:TPR repeat protein